LIQFILLTFSFPYAKGDEKATVLMLTSQTADLTFQISLSHRSYALGEDVVISYTVRNNSRRTVLLVVDPEPRLVCEPLTYSLRLRFPVQYPDDHQVCECHLLKILPRRSFSGKLAIRGNLIPVERGVESQEWDVQVGFSYVAEASRSDLSDLLACKDMNYVLACKRKLFDAAKSVLVGSLVVEVKNH